MRPELGAQFFKTWTVAKPLGTHWRPAGCAEVGCENWMYGWTTTVPTGSDPDLLLRLTCTGQVDGHRRHYTQVPGPDGTTVYSFEAGQTCFALAAHRVPIDRPELYVVRDGNLTRHLGGGHLYDRSDQWVEDMDDHLDSIR